MSDRLVTGAATNTAQQTNIRDEHPCLQRDPNPRFLQQNGRRRMP